MDLIFVAPDPDSFTSGGNLFNRRLIDALRREGRHRMRRLDWEQWVEANYPTGECCLIDSIYLDRWERQPPPGRSAPKPGLLAHYLPEVEDKGYDPRWEWLSSSFGFVIVPSRFMLGRLLARTAFRGPAFVLPPVLDLPEKPELLPAPDPPLALVVANLVPVKGILEFLLALRGEGPLPDFRLQIIGDLTLDPGYTGRCREMASLLRSGGLAVEISPPVPPVELHRRLAGASVLVSTSKFESFGMAVFEAMYFGVPVLGLPAGNLPFLLRPGANGLLPATVEELVGELVRWMQAPEIREYWRARAVENRPAHEFTEARVLQEVDFILNHKRNKRTQN